MSNALQQKLKNDEVVLGLNMNFPAAGIIECMGKGWDWLWIDGQHGQIDYRDMLQCVRVADACGLAPIPRAPDHAYGTIGLVMDMKVAGIMVPMVETPQQARNIVNAACFPPLGNRSFGGRRVVDIGGRGYAETANDDSLIVAQIESGKAVEEAEAIAATDGIDVLFFGPDDMKLRNGIPIDTGITESDKLARAMELTAKAAKNSGKIAGTVVGNKESLDLAVSLGYRLIVGGGDVGFLRTASAEKLKELKSPQ